MLVIVRHMSCRLQVCQTVGITVRTKVVSKFSVSARRAHHKFRDKPAGFPASTDSRTAVTTLPMHQTLRQKSAT
jgi:hypothetical protein